MEGEVLLRGLGERQGYKMEENDEPHPDWMLPDGIRSERLKKVVES